MATSSLKKSPDYDYDDEEEDEENRRLLYYQTPSLLQSLIFGIKLPNLVSIRTSVQESCHRPNSCYFRL